MIRWSEEYEGGSAEAERLLFAKLARDIMAVQLKIQRRAKTASVQRSFHAKAVFAAKDAELRFVEDLPEDLRAGFAQPDRSYPAIVRLSNADGQRQADFKPDLLPCASTSVTASRTTYSRPIFPFPTLATRVNSWPSRRPRRGGRSAAYSA